jgi:hypothetical protein
VNDPARVLTPYDRSIRNHRVLDYKSMATIARRSEQMTDRVNGGRAPPLKTPACFTGPVSAGAGVHDRLGATLD